MTAILKNFVTVRKTRGDILRPAQFRSIVEMIQGILRQYDYSGFNDAYVSFLAHLADHDDPHKVTETSFFEEVIERTYAIYTKMTAAPLSEELFRSNIVPTLGFLELIRRIVLNRYLYNQIKNVDGSVSQTVTAYLNKDWGRSVNTNGPVTLTFNSVMADEVAFLRKGWTTNASPIPAVFNANNLSLEIPYSSVIFHTSRAAPYFNVDDSGSGYPISLFGASNDFTISLAVVHTPITKTVIFSLLNGTNTFSIAMNPDRSVELKIDAQVITSNVPCGEGKLTLTMTKNGVMSLTTFNNSIATVSNFSVDFTNVHPFITGLIGVPLENIFHAIFGLRELTVCKDTYVPVLTGDEIIPMIAYVPAATSNPVIGTADAAGATAALTPNVGYNLYLTLTGTWTGVVRVQRSVDNGLNWATVTSHGGEQTGVYNRNCDEPVLMVTDPRAKYRLQYVISSGVVIYRLAQ